MSDFYEDFHDVKPTDQARQSNRPDLQLLDGGVGNTVNPSGLISRVAVSATLHDIHTDNEGSLALDADSHSSFPLIGINGIPLAIFKGISLASKPKLTKPSRIFSPENVIFSVGDTSKDIKVQHTLFPDRYEHRIGNDSASSPYSRATAMSARRIHAYGYEAYKLVKGTAKAGDELSSDIDKARGANVDYFVSTNVNKPDDMATMRRYNLRPGQTWRALPMAKYCSDKLYEGYEKRLDALPDQSTSCKELCALATTGRAEGVYEIIRNLVQDSIISGRDEKWICAIVTRTHEVLKLRYGKRNVEVIGEDVSFKDDRIYDHISLRPTLIDTERFFKNMIEDIQDIRGDDTKSIAARGRLIESLLCVTDGVDFRYMDPDVAHFVSGQRTNYINSKNV